MNTLIEVLIVGGGPVGLTLAIDLGRRGVRCTIIEQNHAPAFQPKMERCNARTMEIFRRMGIAERIRASGLRSDCPMDVYVVTALNEAPITHHKYPSVAEAKAKVRSCSDGTQSLEPYQLISQYTLEPLLKSVAEELATVTVKYGCRYVSHSQDQAGVTATVEGSDGVQTLRAKYLIGCDGGGSQVRKNLEIALEGEGNLLQLRQSLFFCPDLFEMMPIGQGPGRGRHYHVADASSTMMIMQDSTKHWTLHSAAGHENEMERIFDEVVGVPVRKEMLFCNSWRQNMLLAERYRRGRVFLAGDSAHLVVPFGGLGMNTGIGDAIDLAWKLAGTLQGWGGPDLLRSYEIERRQVGERNIGAARSALLGRRKWRSHYRPNIRDKNSDGECTRAQLATVAEIEQRKSNDMTGAELGYRYVDSPIICNMPGGPELKFREYEPTNWPGARLPHVWLRNGAALQDQIPDGYAILSFGKAAEAEKLRQAFHRCGAPVHVLDLKDDSARAVLAADLLVLRPDLHVVWRGNQLVQEPDQIASTATGTRRSDHISAGGMSDFIAA